MAIAREIKRNQDPEGMLRRALERIIQLYTDKSHFVYELLQNAEDAGASKIRFVQHADELEVLHDGSSFSVENLQSLCDIGKSDKISNLNQIGEFGVGFKSVFGICEEVLLYSSPTREERETGRRKFAVKIENFTNPTDIAFEKFEKEYTTKFVFPYAVGLAFSGFDSIDKLNKAVSRRLQNLGITTLLFMKNLQSISYEIDLPDLKKSGLYSLEKTRINNHCFLVCASGETARKSEEISYLIFSRKVSGMKTGRTIDLAFSVSVDEDGKYTFLKTKNPYISVYFPTEKESKLHFIVQGPFRTTPNRGSVPDDDKDNIELASQMARLLRDSVLELRDMGRLNLSLLNILPISKNDFENAPLFKGMYETVAEMMQKEAVLCCRDGSYATADSVKIARGEKFADLFTDDLLTELIHDGTVYHWLPTVMTETSKEYKTLYAFLRDKIGIKVLRPEEMKDLINANNAFMRNREDKWLVRFYRFYENVSGAFDYSKVPGNMTMACVIKTTRGDFAALYRRIETENGGMTYLQNVFLPPDNEVNSGEISIVDSIIYKKCKAFFDSTLHLQKPDEYELFINDLKVRMETGALKDDKQNLIDIKNFLYFGRMSEHKDEIAELTRKYLYLKCSSLNGSCYINPNIENVFFTETSSGMSIEQYFKYIRRDIIYVNFDFYKNDGITYDELRTLGVRESAAVGEDIISGIYRTGKNSRAKWKTIGNFRWKLSLESLDAALRRIDRFPKETDSIVKSSFIFRFLLENESKLVGTVKIGGSTPDIDPAYSEILQRLMAKNNIRKANETYQWSGRWLYTNTDELVSPREISKRDLHPAYYGEVRPGSVVYEILEFQKNEDDRLEEVERDYDSLSKKEKEQYFSLEVQRRFGISVQELEASLTEHRRSMDEREVSVPLYAGQEFPSVNIKDWNSLKKHAAEMYCYAAPVKYQEVLRSIRVSAVGSTKRVYLSGMYRMPGTSRYACQMCRKSTVNFDAVQIRNEPKFELDPMNLCLCPSCSREYKKIRGHRYEVNHLLNQIRELKDPYIKASDPVKVKLNDNYSVWFTQTHAAEIKELLLLEYRCEK